MFLKKEVKTLKPLEKYDKIVKDLINNKQIQMYGELNVKTSEITNIDDNNDDLVVTVKLVARYLNYITDENHNFISGNKDTREEHELLLKLRKLKDAEKLEESRHCPTRGSLMDISNNGECSYCGSIFNTEDFKLAQKRNRIIFFIEHLLLYIDAAKIRNNSEFSLFV